MCLSERDPLSVGVGIAMVAVSALTSLYYNMILAWAYYYFFASFTSNLPWVTCDNTWNTRGNTAQHTISVYEETSVLTQFGLLNLCCVIAGLFVLYIYIIVISSINDMNNILFRDIAKSRSNNQNML